MSDRYNEYRALWNFGDIIDTLLKVSLTGSTLSGPLGGSHGYI
jgi:hypothetical protein